MDMYSDYEILGDIWTGDASMDADSATLVLWRDGALYRLDGYGCSCCGDMQSKMDADTPVAVAMDKDSLLALATELYSANGSSDNADEDAVRNCMIEVMVRVPGPKALEA